MADDNQTPQVGPVAQPPAQAPANRGVPGTQQPPVPSAEQIAKIQAQQQQALAQQRAQAQQRALEMQSNMPADVPVATTSPTAQRIQSNVPAGPPSPMQQAQQQATAPSPVPGMSAQQVLAGPQQQQPAMQYQQQTGNQFAQFTQQAAPEKPRLPWFPIRSGGAEIELADAIVFGVPDTGIPGEGDAAAKVVLALFSEILYLREQLAMIAQNGGGSADLDARVGQLERVLHEQRMGMQSRARGVREQIEMFTKQGMSGDEIVEALKLQSAAAEQAVAGSE